MLIYAVIGAVGFLILVLMLVVGEVFGGDHDLGGGDVGGDIGGDIGADHAGEFGHEGGPSIFSTRIMAAFLTAFGVGGVVARFFDLSHPAASGIGVACGLVFAGIVYQFARILYAQQSSSEVQLAALVGQTAQVAVGIPEGGVGQVTLVHAGERTTQIARSRDGHAIPVGNDVRISALAGEIVIVERLSPAPPRGGEGTP